MSTYDEHAPNSTPFTRALNRVLSDGRFTAQEMAEVCECSDRHVQKIAAGQAALASDKAEKLCRWLCQNGESRPSLAFFCSGFVAVRRAVGQANGSGKDEMLRLLKAAAPIDDAIQEKDADSLDTIIDNLHQVLADLEAERRQIAAE
jgi:polyhydroxyalkanoate synthesis regulator phasin